MEQYSNQNYGYPGNNPYQNHDSMSYDVPSLAAPVKSNRGTNVLIAVLIALVIINLAFTAIMFFVPNSKALTGDECFETIRNVKNYMKQIGNENISVKKLELDEESEDGDYYSLYVTADVKNTSDEDLSNVTIYFKCYDEDGKFVENTVASIGFLEGKESYDLYDYIYVDEEEVDRIEIDYIMACYAKDVE